MTDGMDPRVLLGRVMQLEVQMARAFPDEPELWPLRQQLRRLRRELFQAMAAPHQHPFWRRNAEGTLAMIADRLESFAEERGE